MLGIGWVCIGSNRTSRCAGSTSHSTTVWMTPFKLTSRNPEFACSKTSTTRSGSSFAPARYEAEQRYRKNERTQIVLEGGGLHESSNAVLGNASDRLVNTTVEVTGDNEARVSNPRGQIIIKIPTLHGQTGGPHVLVREEVQDGLLWEPGVVDQKHAVLLNAGHPFYQRFYLANRDNPVAVQGANFLLWALCEAELYAMSEGEREHMNAVRREVSRILRELAKEMPEVSAAS